MKLRFQAGCFQVHAVRWEGEPAELAPGVGSQLQDGGLLRLHTCPQIKVSGSMSFCPLEVSSETPEPASRRTSKCCQHTDVQWRAHRALLRFHDFCQDGCVLGVGWGPWSNTAITWSSSGLWSPETAAQEAPVSWPWPWTPLSSCSPATLRTGLCTCCRGQLTASPPAAFLSQSVTEGQHGASTLQAHSSSQPKDPGLSGLWRNPQEYWRLGGGSFHSEFTLLP